MKKSAEILEGRVKAAFPDAPLETGPQGLQRILERRARGERVALTDRASRGYWRYGLAAAAAAATLVIFGPLTTRDRPAPGSGTAVGQVASTALMPAQLMAQGASHPSYPIAVLDGREVRPGDWTYAVLRGNATFAGSAAVQRMRVRSAEYSGRPAWLVLTRPTPDSSALHWLDSAWVDKGNLRLLARSVSVMQGNGRVTDEFREHEVLRGFATNRSTTWTVIEADTTSEDVSAGVPLQGDVFFMALKRAPLAAGWRGSIQLLATPIYNRAARRWLDLAVVGEERVVVPAGEFQCWKIRFGPPAEYSDLGPLYLWVSKAEQWIVQQGSDGGPQGGFRSVLVAGEEAETTGE